MHKEYPNKIAHFMTSDADLKPPRQLTPAFYGCYDWHSSVHGHWLLARVIKLFPNSEAAKQARAALAQSLTPQNIASRGRVHHRAGSRIVRAAVRHRVAAATRRRAARVGRRAVPRMVSDAGAARSGGREASSRAWLPKLGYPIRVGEHDQTAFAFGLVWDWARTTRDGAMEALLREKAKQFYLSDKGCPLAYEPSGQDFLSPCLAEADFVRRVLTPARVRAMAHDLPAADSGRRLDGMVAGCANHRSQRPEARAPGRLESQPRVDAAKGSRKDCPQDDKRRNALRATARLHTDTSLGAVTSEHYVGSHWLGTFALYGASRDAQKGLR